MAEHTPEDFDDFEEPIPEGHVLCPRCDGHMSVNCHCGGDLCVCENYGEKACPLCGGEYGGEGYVPKETADRYFKTQAEMRAAISSALGADASTEGESQ